MDYLTNKDIFSLDALPSSLIVVGGGPIGCEMSQAFARLGTDVRILQRNCQVLSVEDQDMAAVVQDSLRAEGVGLDLCANTKEVRRVPGGIEVEYESDGVSHVIKAEKILVAAGVRRTLGI